MITKELGKKYWGYKMETFIMRLLTRIYCWILLTGTLKRFINELFQKKINTIFHENIKYRLENLNDLNGFHTPLRYWRCIWVNIKSFHDGSFYRIQK